MDGKQSTLEYVRRRVIPVAVGEKLLANTTTQNVFYIGLAGTIEQKHINARDRRAHGFLSTRIKHNSRMRQ